MHSRSRHLIACAVVAVILSACSPSAGGGPVIHVNLAVPLATQAPIGSDCGAADLTETGPKAATIPGAPVEFFDIDQALANARAPETPRAGETMGSQQPEQPDATNNIEGLSVGKPTVPDTGVVAEPISDDPDFPTACVFTFDVATTADVERAYGFSIGSVYFPIPAMLRADLEAAGWVANIGVNPQ